MVAGLKNKSHSVGEWLCVLQTEFKIYGSIKSLEGIKYFIVLVKDYSLYLICKNSKFKSWTKVSSASIMDDNIL